jgi:hypothetical protein
VTPSFQWSLLRTVGTESSSDAATSQNVNMMKTRHFRRSAYPKHA